MRCIESRSVSTSRRNALARRTALRQVEVDSVIPRQERMRLDPGLYPAILHVLFFDERSVLEGLRGIKFVPEADRPTRNRSVVQCKMSPAAMNPQFLRRATGLVGNSTNATTMSIRRILVPGAPWHMRTLCMSYQFDCDPGPDHRRCRDARVRGGAGCVGCRGQTLPSFHRQGHRRGPPCQGRHGTAAATIILL